MQTNNKSQNKDNSQIHGDLLVWRVTRQKQQMQNERITRAYNLRARERYTKH